MQAVDPHHLVVDRVTTERNLLYIRGRRFDLNGFNQIHVLGAGKGAAYLYLGLKEVLGQRIAGGIIVSSPAHGFTDERVKFLPGSHPIPDETSLEAGRAVVHYARERVGKKDLVFFLVTGGASAMLVHPAPGVEFQDKVAANCLLISSRAGINEINCVRKHLSLLKGGGLAKMVYPARMITLVVSDIVDSPLEDIGSGPTVADPTTFADAYQVLEKYCLLPDLPPQIKNYFLKGIKKKIADTPSPGTKIFANHHHFLLADNLTALEAAKAGAAHLGLEAHILTSRDQGEAAGAAKVYSAVVKEIIRSRQPFKPPVLLLSGGELTVALKGKGKGGRNQEFVLSMLKDLKKVTHPFHVLSMGTDGIDGPTDAAGAWIDEKTSRKAKRLNLDIEHYLDNNDSYHFFQKIDQLIKTGPTRTNVADLRMFYLGGREK